MKTVLFGAWNGHKEKDKKLSVAMERLLQGRYKKELMCS